MSRTMARLVAALLALALVAAACSSDDSGGGDGSGDGGDGGGEEAAAVEVDYEAIGLWDDGPCDEAMEPLKIGLMTVFESPVLSLEDQAIALEASAEAFNARGGANGACIEVTTCDDGGNADQARGLRTNRRRGRCRGHGERPGHRRPGRRVAGHGGGGDPPGRVERHVRGLG